MKKKLRDFIPNIRPVTAVEYALLGGLVAVSLIAGARGVETKNHSNFEQLTHNF